MNNQENDIKTWLQTMGITRYKLKRGKIDIMGDVNLSGRGISEIPFEFGIVSGNFDCSRNQLQSLDNLPRHVHGDINFRYNRITSLVGIEKKLLHVSGSLYLNGNPIVEGGIGAIRIGVLSGIEADPEAFEIIARYLQNERDLFDCQTELIEQGFEPFAQL